MIVAATGHRPDKLGGYSESVRVRLRLLAVSWLVENRPNKIISGMALGWDQAVAEAAVELYIPFIAAIPFKGQELHWPQSSQDRYTHLLSLADSVTVVSSGSYATWKMQTRNEWMVNQCNLVLALWDGSSGGTGNCIKYARQQLKPIENLWTQWSK